MKRHWITLSISLLVIIGLAITCAPNIFYKNSGESISLGTTGNGSLQNAYQIDYKTTNSKYFSPVSYFLIGNCYVHSRLYKTILDSYAECERTCKGKKFRVMECSLKKGGKTLIHRTHMNGLSVDFMVPKLNKGKQIKLYDRMGLWHYLLNFDSTGKLKIDKNLTIDFETMSRHIIALDNAAKRNGLSINKVILKIDLKDDLFNTVSGREIKRRGIYFAQNLTKTINMVHDDHYHVDFKINN